MTVVYIDILLLINFIVNLLLLRVSAFFAGRSFSLLKCALSSFLGALSALVIFLPPCSFFAMAFYKLIFCQIMIFAAFGYDNLRKFLKDMFCLFTSSVLFSGLMLFIYITVTPKRMTVYNGAFYLDINALSLIITALTAYVFVSGVQLLFMRKKPDEEYCTVTVYHNNKAIRVKALLDNGSSLREPFSHLPVIVCENSVFNEEINPEKAVENGFRMIPFEHISGRGVLPAFLAERVDIIGKKGNVVDIKKGCYVAITPAKIGNGEYDAIVNPVILQNQ